MASRDDLGAQCPRNRLVGTVYLDTVDYTELCSSACGHALDCAISFRLAFGTIVVATLIVHLVMSWWAASGALH